MGFPCFRSPGVNDLSILIGHGQFSPCDFFTSNILLADHDGIIDIFVNHDYHIFFLAANHHIALFINGERNRFRFFKSIRGSDF